MDCNKKRDFPFNDHGMVLENSILSHYDCFELYDVEHHVLEFLLDISYLSFVIESSL